ncbi:MAG: transporter substrate-binding domain-containing protein [Desulfobacteraceae bacterium]|nr:transporter substrate-binding domain-containing protein [Desulfobacteraceae bacterium]
MKKIALFIVALFMVYGPAFAETKIILGTSEWSPYFASDLKNNGPLAEVVKAAFEKSGYTVEIQFMDWNRAVGLSKTGKIDGLLGCYYSKERAEVLELSEPFGESTVVLFAKKGSGISYNSLEDLKSYKIGTMRGNKVTDEFDSASYLKKEPANDIEVNIKKLLAGRIDIFVESKFVAQDVINSKFAQDKDKIEVLNPPLKTNTLHIGISKKIANAKKIQQDLDAGLKAIKDDGTMDKILKSHGF